MGFRFSGLSSDVVTLFTKPLKPDLSFSNIGSRFPFSSVGKHGFKPASASVYAVSHLGKLILSSIQGFFQFIESFFQGYFCFWQGFFHGYACAYPTIILFGSASLTFTYAPPPIGTKSSEFSFSFS